MAENKLILDKHLLVCCEVDVEDQNATGYNYLKSHFCGRVLDVHEGEELDSLHLTPPSPDGIVYVCGNVRRLANSIKKADGCIKVIRELSEVVADISGVEYVTLGEVPINLYNAAVYYRNCLGAANYTRKSSSIPVCNESFPSNDTLDQSNYFDRLQTRHKFQTLTQSNKPGTAFRKGIYLSEIVKTRDGEDAPSEFYLLRCSANLSGPTLAFAREDREIISKVNALARQSFELPTELNHVLAQVYENSVTIDGARKKAKEHKAKIKSHSDKTKDMPSAGLIAFCTFYSPEINSNTYKSMPHHDRFNRYFKDASVLTQLRFKLKHDAKAIHPDPAAEDFLVTLYPDSVLLIPLSTNRLYTHEIVPPTLPVGRFPTRLGYVVRCSKTKAVFRNGATFIKRPGGTEAKLVEAQEGEVEELKGLYQRENTTVERIKYRDFNFSLNAGDYLRPMVG